MLCTKLFDSCAFLCQNALLKTVEFEKKFKKFQSSKLLKIGQNALSKRIAFLFDCILGLDVFYVLSWCTEANALIKKSST